MNRVYLDYAATTPVHPEVMAAMQSYFTDIFGNPSSIYAYGQEAREALEKSRKTVADFLGAGHNEIFFTSGGTESDNFALKGIAIANEDKGKHIIVSSIEHHAVLETCKFLEGRGFRVTYLPVDEYGMVSPDEVKKGITPETILVSIMHANNEIGTIQPLAEISRITREAGIYFHTDAVQTVGHLPVDVKALGVDLLSVSAHKLYGPKGVGALYIKKGTRIVPFQHGGTQEKGKRAGTENIPGIVGLARACEIAGKEMGEEAVRLEKLRNKLIRDLMERIDSTRLNGHPEKRLPGNANLSFDFVEGESMCLNLDLEGVCVSTGSACSSGDAEPSHVLLATGVPPQKAYSSLRFTLGKWSTEEDIERVIAVLPPIVEKLRAISPLGNKD